ncbi:3'-5' exonuclease family protein [Sabulicella glaciei]|uniref:Exonuclease domain-containing protein n=1 Tax=Sabulicella glaciei TaxID=2984948 RepID=A0ABT3NUA0_9PROT|nr:hypothetical protein [Roseococcus sp. MDT2-1-1]MCW8085729.1 hypothetical protein [Roseococcus sp. MDT2-1-1]
MGKPVCCIDLEATSLSEASVPIELGWAAETDESGRCLIRPAPDWTDWDERSAAVHGIGRAELEAGLPVAEVAAILRRLARRYVLLSDAPLMDGHWIARLFESETPEGVMPERGPRLLDAAEAAWTEASRLLSLDPSCFAPGEAERLRQQLIAGRIWRLRDDDSVRHRALPDAERLMRAHLWLAKRVQQIIQEVAS